MTAKDQPQPRDRQVTTELARDVMRNYARERGWGWRPQFEQMLVSILPSDLMQSQVGIQFAMDAFACQDHLPVIQGKEEPSFERLCRSAVRSHNRNLSSDETLLIRLATAEWVTEGQARLSAVEVSNWALFQEGDSRRYDYDAVQRLLTKGYLVVDPEVTDSATVNGISSVTYMVCPSIMKIIEPGLADVNTDQGSSMPRASLEDAKYWAAREVPMDRFVNHNYQQDSSLI